MLIRTLFVLPMQNGDYHYMNLTSKVVRIMKQENGDIYSSLQFIGVTPQETQLLLRFSFDRQLAMKKKGLSQLKRTINLILSENWR